MTKPIKGIKIKLRKTFQFCFRIYIYISSNHRQAYNTPHCVFNNISDIRVQIIPDLFSQLPTMPWETKHGMSTSPIYKLYHQMIQRCYNNNQSEFKNYGGRGITVCDEWKNPDTGFETFYGDLGERPGRSYSIERRDNDAPYSKANCYWATRSEQNRNRRNNHHLEYKGKEMLLCELAELVGVASQIIASRLSRGWPIEKAILKWNFKKNCPL